MQTLEMSTADECKTLCKYYDDDNGKYGTYHPSEEEPQN